VVEIADEDFFTTEPGAPLDEVFFQMNAQDCSTVPVVDADQLVGLLTLENVGELIMVSSALKSRAPDRVLSGKEMSEIPARRSGGAPFSGSPTVP
jgi:CBS domain-containing protein